MPAPGALVIVISPPISSARRRQITRPRPVPPKRRVVPTPACVKGWKSSSWTSAAMPMPVSRTASSMRWPAADSSSTRTVTSMPPTSVNFTALERKLLRIWRSRIGSPTSAGASSASISADSSSPLIDAVCTKLFTAASTSSRSPIVTGSMSSLPASIFEKSRTSPMIVMSDCAELCDVSSIPRWCSSRFVRAAPRASPSRRSSACGSRGSSPPGTRTSRGWRARRARAPPRPAPAPPRDGRCRPRSPRPSR